MKLVSNVPLSLLALLILIDYFLTGKKETEVIIEINNSFESYNNAAGNSHYSRKIKSFNFNISDSYSELINRGDTIVIEESPIFKEINASKIIKDNYSETYSLRRISGLFIPLLLLITSILNYKYKDKILILLVVSKVLLVGNLIHLVL